MIAHKQPRGFAALNWSSRVLLAWIVVNALLIASMKFIASF